MKSIQIILTALLVSISSFAFAHTSLNAFAGNWENIDNNTRGLTKVLVKIKSGNPYVQGYGACSPRDCNWGSIKGTYFKTDGKNFISANYKHNNGITNQIVMRISGDKMIAKVHTTFKDSRKPMTKYYTMKKKNSTSEVGAFSGIWVNQDANTRGLTKVKVKVTGNTPYVHGFGSCSPRDCDWGNIRSTFFNTDGKNFISANYKFDNGITQQIVMRLSGGKMIAKVHSTYKDSRKPQTNYYTMRRQ